MTIGIFSNFNKETLELKCDKQEILEPCWDHMSWTSLLCNGSYISPEILRIRDIPRSQSSYDPDPLVHGSDPGDNTYIKNLLKDRKKISTAMLRNSLKIELLC